MKVTPPAIKRSRRVLHGCLALHRTFSSSFALAMPLTHPKLLRLPYSYVFFLLRFREKIVDPHICSDKRKQSADFVTYAT